MTILALLQCLQPIMTKTDLSRMSQILKAMLSMTGRVTMLGISRWTDKGGSYRTVQRFFNTEIPWPKVFKQFFEAHLYKPEGEYILVGDESTVTKSGKDTYGLDRFFSGVLNKVVKGIAIFSLSLVSIEERSSYPLQVEQVVRTGEEKAVTKARKEKRDKKEEKTQKRKRGRPKGSKNQVMKQVELSPELKRIQKMVLQQLKGLKNLVSVRYLALDGHFGNSNALQMVRQCGLQLISKLRHDAALYFTYEGPQKSKGRHRKYGQKIDYHKIPEKYLVETSTEGNIQTRVYQVQLLHKSFALPLNVVILTKLNLQTGAFASVNLFSSDLELSYEKIIDYYSLRFQIEFNFRDAKQFWGLEDFMNVKELPLTNAINLSLFMVNLSQVLLRDYRKTYPKSGILDLKAYFRAAKYFQEIIKLLPQKPEPFLLDQIFDQASSLGCIHHAKVPISSP